MVQDRFQLNADSPSAPSQFCFAVAPDDAAELSQATKALYVGTGGDIALIPVRNTDTVIFRNVPDGAILDVRVRAVLATGTTAANLVGLA